MSKKKKLLLKILAGNQNILFSELLTFLIYIGFELKRVKGSHYMFYHEEVKEFINIQSVNGKVKSYQLRQVIQIIEKHNLFPNDDFDI